MSSPHFLNAEEYLEVDGIQSPDEFRHGSYLDIEPNTGVVISAKRRIQVSLKFWRSRSSADRQPEEFKKLKSKVYPMFCFEVPYEASDKIKEEMSKQLVAGFTFLRILPFIFSTAAAIMN